MNMEQKGLEGQISKESVERGKDVEILIKFGRHGDRYPLGPQKNMLTDRGRADTRANAEASGLRSEDFDAVKPIGSNVKPHNEEGEGRALESARIYGETIAGDELFNTRETEVLNYETMKTKGATVYDHVAVYNSSLPEDYASLSPEQQAYWAEVAQTHVTNHILSLNTPEAIQYRKEGAGMLAYIATHYGEVATRLKPHSRVLIPAGTHGTFMEFLMKEALVRHDKDGNEIRGFQTLDEIGGPQQTSEAFTVRVATDDDGKKKPLTFTFDNPKRPEFKDMVFDRKIVEELAEFYKKLHPELRALRENKG
jgi:hypothetical protein